MAKRNLQRLTVLELRDTAAIFSNANEPAEVKITTQKMPAIKWGCKK